MAMKTNTLEQDKKKLQELLLEQQKLEPARKKYYELSIESCKLADSIREREKQELRWALIRKTDYEEPEYPDMGVQGCNGSAVFGDEKTAKELVTLLRDRTYYYGYLLEWSGPGRYTVVPSYKHDHDNEVIYTATFQKEGE